MSTQFSSIRPIDRTLSGARVDLGTMVMKGYSAFSKAPPALHIQDSHLRGILPLCRKPSMYSTAPADWASVWVCICVHGWVLCCIYFIKWSVYKYFDFWYYMGQKKNSLKDPLKILNSLLWSLNVHNSNHKLWIFFSFLLLYLLNWSLILLPQRKNYWQIYQLQ